jgi:hypothetical protein
MRSIGAFRPLSAVGAATIPALAALTLVLAPAGASAKGSSHASGPTKTGTPFNWVERVAPGKTIAIVGVNGGIRAEPASGAEAMVEATKTARKSDPDEVHVRVNQRGDVIQFCVCYPQMDGSDGKCCSWEEHGQEIRDNDVRVDFVVHVPEGVKLELSTINGNVEATGLRASVEAVTVNGDVDIATSGLARASTVNGAIDVRMGASSLRDDLAFATVNGPIRLEVPARLDADVTATTMSGSIRTDFDLPVFKEFMNSRMSGTIGRGGHDLKLSTVNGRIELRAKGAL